MKKFIKENWFKLGILIIVFMLSLVYVYNNLYLNYKFSKCYKTHVEKNKVEENKLSSKTIIDVEKYCGGLYKNN